MKRSKQKFVATAPATAASPERLTVTQPAGATGAAGTAPTLNPTVEVEAEEARERTARRIRKEMKEDARRRAEKEGSRIDGTIHSQRGDGDFFTS